MPSAPSIEEGSRRAQRSRSCIAIGSREGFQWSSSSRNSAQPSHPFYGGGHLDSTERRARTTLAATSRRAQIGMSGVSDTERFRRRGLGVRGVGLEARLSQAHRSTPAMRSNANVMVRWRAGFDKPSRKVPSTVAKNRSE